MTPVRTHAPPAARSRSRLRGPSPERAGFGPRFVVACSFGSVLNPVNSSIIAVALASIGRAFGAGPASTTWLVSALYLATAIGQPTAGRLADLLGPRRVYLAGTVLVAAGGVLGCLAGSLAVLVVSRVVIGSGTSAAYPAAMALVPPVAAAEAGSSRPRARRARHHRPGQHGGRPRPGRRADRRGGWRLIFLVAAAGLLRTAMYLGAIASASLIGLCYGRQATGAGLHRLAVILVLAAAALLAVTLADRSTLEACSEQ
jgi:MFS family permease